MRNKLCVLTEINLKKNKSYIGNSPKNFYRLMHLVQGNSTFEDRCNFFFQFIHKHFQIAYYLN